MAKIFGMRKIQNVDEYLLKGCGRCEKFDTEKCKVKIWNKEIRLLRDILLQTKLKEELKWSQPCYTFNGKNVCLLAVFKSYCAVSFFKGALINDVFQVLEKPGEHSHQVRMMKFVNVEQIMDRKEILLNYIQQAIELEEKGVVFNKLQDELEYPAELIKMFQENPELKQAFEKLTPGRKRSYLIHFNSAKQSQTIENRIKKCIPKILMGKGFNEY